MRLTSEEVGTIKAAAREAFGESAVVRLFGSRVDADRDGGDVDLHVEADAARDIWRRRLDFLLSVHQRLDHEKIDVVLSQRGTLPRGFERIAYRDGVVL